MFEGVSPKNNLDVVQESREVREKLVVKKIYQFTHPEYDMQFRMSSRRKEELQRLWREKIDEIASERDSLLFYVAAFQQWMYKGLAESKKDKEPQVSGFKFKPALERDLKRIVECKQKLGERFILIFESLDQPGGHIPKKESVQEVLGRRHIEIDKSSLSFECFGEYVNACVPTQARLLKKALGIEMPDEIAESEINSRLSLNATDG